MVSNQDRVETVFMEHKHINKYYTTVIDGLIKNNYSHRGVNVKVNIVTRTFSVVHV